MATMMKEKRREKKKTKEKNLVTSVVETKQPTRVNELTFTDEENPAIKNDEIIENLPKSDATENFEDAITSFEDTVERQVHSDTPTDTPNVVCTYEQSCIKTPKEETKENNSSTDSKQQIIQKQSIEDIGNTYSDLNSRLQKIRISNVNSDVPVEELESRLLYTDAYIRTESTSLQASENVTLEEPMVPSAPVFEEEEKEVLQTYHYENVVEIENKPKVQCMPLEEAIRMYGGTEMAEIAKMSEKEEASVEAGPVSGPEHPLVDLLSTFRCSLTAMERERIQLARGYAQEEVSRAALWKVEKRNVNMSEKCSCGTNVELKATYEHAELLKEKLPVARLRLESLLRDVQDSFCHHQHAALLAHCQIEELISEIIKANKNAIREALSLVLQALRLCDGTPAALAAALQRWAAALTTALLDGRDVRQLLFLLHHLFRQTRSVRWAARLIHVPVGDNVEAARAIALLDLLLTRHSLEPAVECTEESEEAWEEVDRHGSGCAVSDGALRERDLLALLRAFSMRDLVARLVLFTHSDVRVAREHEWRVGGAGAGALRAACGARALVATLGRGVTAQYVRLQRALRARTHRALRALAALHAHARSSYSKELEEKVNAEMEASFALGFTVLGGHEPYKLPATLLRDDTARDYCFSFIVSLHEKSPKRLEKLSVEMPVLPCSLRVRVIAQAAADRTDDHELARIVLDFLFQTGIKRKSSPCKGGCEEAARNHLSLLLDSHPYLYPTALHILADLNEAETLEPSSVKSLRVERWRPTCSEVIAVLDDWSRRCPLLLQHLLLQLDYTPHVGVSLECQLAIGWWVCGWVRRGPGPEAAAWCWRAVRRLRVHRVCWGLPLDAPPPPPPEDEPLDPFSSAYAVLSSSWGHCIPLVCSRGVSALRAVSAANPLTATHCAAPVLLVMAHSPESVALTPGFSEVFEVLLGSGPTLVQRALGRGPAPGTALLLRLLLAHLSVERCGGVPRSAVLSVWLHALWRPSLPPAALSLLDTAMLCCREWPQLDRHAAMLMQEENAKEYLQHAVRNVSIAPLVCESVLRAAHAQRELRAGTYGALVRALARQRAAAQKTHVDRALQQIGANISSEELVIYRLAAAVLSAPLRHPSHLTLWRMFLHLYLQRQLINEQESLPVGPLFFSGIIKTRILRQLKRRLQDTATYHHSEAETLKTENCSSEGKEPSPSGVIKSSSRTIDSFLPSLSINDLTGESSDSESSVSESSDTESTDGETDDMEDTKKAQEGARKIDVLNLIRYHTAAEKMVREYLRWLEEGERTRAEPHHADIARFIPEQALEAAWNRELERNRPPPSPEEEDFPLPLDTPPPAPKTPATPFQIAISTILSYKSDSRRRSRRLSVKSPLRDVNFNDHRSLLVLVDKLLGEIKLLAEEWCGEVGRVCSLDGGLWPLVGALRVRRPLPPVTKHCPRRCKPITFHVDDNEWCISTGAEQGIRENRSCARAALRRLARARPHAAAAAAALAAIARRINNRNTGISVVQRAWGCACASRRCAPAHLALTALVTDLAERWVCHDGKLCAELLSRWCGSGGELEQSQQLLCGALVAPRRLPPADWPVVYMTLLKSPLPSHTIFSYLSKFEISRWSEVADRAQRREMLDALHAAAQRWGSDPHKQHHVLLELVGVHAAALTDGPELGGACARAARACSGGTFPPHLLPHLRRAAADHAHRLPLDQLGHILRELGVIWWEARTGLKGAKVGTQCGAYALHMAGLLHTLQRAFVSAAIQLSYTPERVSWYAWSTLQESWAAWVSPHPAAPLLLPPAADDHLHTTMLKHFVDNIHQIMLDCPGCEEYLLQHVWEWTIQCCVVVHNSPGSRESRAQVTAMLAELAKLPWNEHQWFSEKCLQALLQVCALNESEVSAWCCEAMRCASAERLMGDGTGAGTEHRLAALLHVFTSPGMPVHRQTLHEVTLLPWWQLPEPALDQALERYFIEHHDPSRPYHASPQYNVVLHASELRVRSGAGACVGAGSRAKRACAASHWLRAACAPALHAHVAAHTAHVLDTLTALAPHLEESEGELEDLLSRVVTILCIEPAASVALPVWLRWLGAAPRRAVVAAATAAAAVTALEPFATLADCVAKTLVTAEGAEGWSEVRGRWRSCPWREGAPLVSRCRLHAAYGLATAHAHAHTRRGLRDTLLALNTANINFVENEPIAALWVCYACRVACDGAEGVEGEGTEGSGEREECVKAASALFASWAEEPGLAILRIVTLQSNTDKPTAKIRLLSRLAQCVLNPNNESAIRAYESCCGAVGGAAAAASGWGRAVPRSVPWGCLPRLALQLFPNSAKYFKEELELASKERE